jgi:hypothetical protein
MFDQAALKKAQGELEELNAQKEESMAALQRINEEAARPYDAARSPGLAANIVLMGRRLATVE